MVKRAFINVIRNPRLVKYRFFQTLLIAIYMGGIYCRFSGDYLNFLNWRSLSGYLFAISIGTMLMAMGPIGLTFPSERRVFLKE